MLFRASGDWCSDPGWLLPTNGHCPVFVEMPTGGVGYNKWIMVVLPSFVVVVFVVVTVVFGQKPARIGKDGKPLLNRSQIRFQNFSWNILSNFFDGSWDYNNIPGYNFLPYSEHFISLWWYSCVTCVCFHYGTTSVLNLEFPFAHSHTVPTVLYFAILCHTLPYCAILCHTLPCYAILFHAGQNWTFAWEGKVTSRKMVTITFSGQFQIFWIKLTAFQQLAKYVA